MAAYWRLWEARGTVLVELDALTKAADDARGREIAAGLRIQSAYRGYVARCRHRRNRRAALQIQRAARGMLGRRRAKERAADRERVEAAALSHYFAVLIQRSFRGFHSRRYRHDFRARKAYLASVAAEGEALRQRLGDRLARQEEEERQRAERARAEAFRQTASNLHHLTSTRAIPGVYGDVPATGATAPTVAGRPVESHLAAVVRDVIRIRARERKAPLARDINGTVRLAPPLPLSRRSLQASEPYGAHEAATKAEERVSRLKWQAEAGFRAGGRVKEKLYERGIHGGSEYLDRRRNPYTIRGVPTGAADLDPGRTTLGKAPRVPFYARAGGNKSAVLPNGRFDVIAEAQVGGGVTGRHRSARLGNTKRFGVPDTCDVDTAVLRNEVRMLRDLEDDFEDEHGRGGHAAPSQTQPLRPGGAFPALGAAAQGAGAPVLPTLAARTV